MKSFQFNFCGNKEKFIRDRRCSSSSKVHSRPKVFVFIQAVFIQAVLKKSWEKGLAKIMLNCLWGKLAQREKMSQTEYIGKPSQYFDLITNPNIIVKNEEIFDNECPFILVNYETKLVHMQLLMLLWGPT